MDNQTPDPALHYSDNRETRIFDFRRYELSHRLPGVIDGLMTRKCFHAGPRNNFTVDITDDQGCEINYEIYFTASKSSKPGILNLYIESAYVRDNAHRANKPQRKPIGFQIILFNTRNSIPIKVPK